jgi:hypothetical protein
VDQQWTWHENQALARRLHAAKLKGAAVEDIDYRTSRGLDKSVIRALAQKSAWVEQHENIFVLGPTGVGKSFVACALAQKACRDGFSALYAKSVTEKLRAGILAGVFDKERDGIRCIRGVGELDLAELLTLDGALPRSGNSRIVVFPVAERFRWFGYEFGDH